MARSLWLILCLFVFGLFRTTSHAQTGTKMATYRTLVGFQQDLVVDSIRVEVVNFDNDFTPKLCKPYPVGTNYYYSHLAKNVAILSDGNTLLLNIKQFNILNGFVKLDANKNYNCFMSRMAKSDGSSGTDAALMFGLVGYAAHELNKEAKSRQSMAYVFIKSSARLHILNPATVERLLQPYPEMFYAFKTDPTKSEIETMITYLEILEELEVNRSK